MTSKEHRAAVKAAKEAAAAAEAAAQAAEAAAAEYDYNLALRRHTMEASGPDSHPPRCHPPHSARAISAAASLATLLLSPLAAPLQLRPWGHVIPPSRRREHAMELALLDTEARSPERARVPRPQGEQAVPAGLREPGPAAAGFESRSPWQGPEAAKASHEQHQEAMRYRIAKVWRSFCFGWPQRMGHARRARGLAQCPRRTSRCPPRIEPRPVARAVANCSGRQPQRQRGPRLGARRRKTERWGSPPPTAWACWCKREGEAMLRHAGVLLPLPQRALPPLTGLSLVCRLHRGKSALPALSDVGRAGGARDCCNQGPAEEGKKGGRTGRVVQARRHAEWHVINAGGGSTCRVCSM